MICSYMVTELGIDVETAINTFEKARGHKIENAKKWLCEDAQHGFKHEQ